MRYTPATGTISIVIDPGEDAAVTVETAAEDRDPESPPGAILFSASDLAGFLDYNNGAGSGQCGSASISNTVSIVVLGQPSDDERFVIDEWDTSARFDPAITWALDLRSNTAVGIDEFDWWGNDGMFVDAPNDDTVTLTDGSFDINGGIGELNGVEHMFMYGGDGDDVLDGSAVTAGVTLDLEGIDDDDWIAPGHAAPQAVANTPIGDFASGGNGVDTLSYGTRIDATVIDNNLGRYGHDANGDCDVLDVGDEADFGDSFEVLETGSGNDCIVGLWGLDETYIPGDGDDQITGQAVDLDLLDWSSSAAGMVIDPGLGTATGQGTDTFTDVCGFNGSALDDTLIWDAGSCTSRFVGGDGTDSVDASATTGGESIDLDALDGQPFDGAGAPADSDEIVVGGSGNDFVVGNDIRNRIYGGPGGDDLEGDDGNDTLIGGVGNDRLSGAAGFDVGRGGPGRDNCYQVEIRDSCVRRGTPSPPARVVAANKLTRL